MEFEVCYQFYGESKWGPREFEVGIVIDESEWEPWEFEVGIAVESVTDAVDNFSNTIKNRK